MNIKFLKRIVLLPVCLSALVISAGCNAKTYTFYTNMPQTLFEVADKKFVQGETIGGYSAVAPEYEQIDTTGYESKGRQYFAMDTYAELVVSDNFNAEGAEERYTSFYKAVGTELDCINKAISSTVNGSDIYNFNQAGSGAKIQISKITYEVLSEAKEMYTLTGGYYNPALYYNIQIYGFGGAINWPENADGLPDDELLKKYTDLASHFGEMQLSVEQTDNGEEYFVTKPEYTVEVDGQKLSLKLDLGGIGKGYAVDVIDKMFDDYGYKFGVFSFGTSSMLLKSNVQEGAYNIFFTNPRSNKRDTYLCIPVRNEKLSSSGDNEKYYIIDGVRYCHIISPVTGKPVQTGIMSATVIGGSAAEADALTTAIMAMEQSDAIKFIEQNLNDRKVVFTCE